MIDLNPRPLRLRGGVAGGVVLCAAIALACDGAGADDGAPAHAAPADPSACVAFLEEGLTFSTASLDAVLDALGPPDVFSARAVGHDPRVVDTPAAASGDSVYRIEYAGLQVSAHKTGGGGDAMVDEVRIRGGGDVGARYLRFPDLGVGAPAERVTAALGEPAERSDDRLVYACHSHPATDDPVTFRLENGTVREVVFTFYMD